MTNDEWILVGQAKHGDAHAFAHLYKRYYDWLLHYRYSVVTTARKLPHFYISVRAAFAQPRAVRLPTYANKSSNRKRERRPQHE